MKEFPHEIRDLVSSDLLQEAIDRLSDEAEGLMNFPEDSLILLGRRLTTVEEQHRKGTITWQERMAVRQDIADAILKTVHELLPPSSAQVPARGLGRGELKARGHYLRHMRKHVENLLHESIHNARFIDLKAVDAPIATTLPWIYKNPDTTQEFASIADAFRVYERRLLILGAPGAGKSVTLLHLARDLINEAERDPAAPVPLIVNLSKFQFQQYGLPLLERLRPREKRTPSANRSFESWLVAEFAERPGIPHAEAQRWVEEGRVAALLDGLDEVNDERRAEMAELLNSTYLRHYPYSTVVICSRIEEYRPLQDRKSTRLQLPGAIMLQPFSPAQIAAYLDAARASGLRQALGRDPTLDELAQTPLTLSMMTLAYGDRSAEDIPSFNLVADQRHHLMESFVSRMVQRKERRDRNIPFDGDADKDVKPTDCCYHPEQVNRFLSWLAVSLSVRMQTACSLGRFHSFIERDQKGPPQTKTAWVALLSRAVLVTLCLLLATLGFAPHSVGYIFAVLAAFFCFCGTRHALSVADRSVKRWGWDEDLISLPVVALLFVTGFAAISRSMVVVVTPGLAAMPVGLIALTGCIAVISLVTVYGDPSDKDPLLFTGGTAVGFALGVAIGFKSFGGWASVNMLAASMTVGAAFGCFMFFRRQEGKDASVAAIVVPLVIVAIVLTLQAGGLWLVGSLHWAVVFGLVGTILVLVGSDLKGPTELLVGLSLASGVGGLWSGKEGAVLASAAFGFLMLAWLLALRERKSDGRRLIIYLSKVSKEVSERIIILTDHRILSPASLIIAAAFGLLPWRVRQFLKYGGQALILKPFSGEIEFVHRRLRDYFALRELIPQLRKSDPQQRLGVIRAIGFQGVAAIDLLSELIAGGGTEEKVVAIGAIARISAPEVAGHLLRAFASPTIEVRLAVIGNLRNLRQEDCEHLLRLAAGDLESRVQTAVVDALHDGLHGHHSDEARALIRQMIVGGRHPIEILRHVGSKTDAFITFVGQELPGPCRAFLEALLLDVEPYARAASCQWMGENGPLANVASILILLNTDPAALVRKKAADALGKLGDPRAVEPLIRALADKEPGVRVVTVSALGRLRDPRAVEPLIQALADDYPGVRQEAARALQQLGDARALEPLIRALTDKVAGVRMAAASALGWLDDPRAVDPLVRVLTDKESDVRERTAEALGRLGGLQAVQPLIRALADKKPGVRGKVAEALGKLKDLQAVQPLIRTLTDKDYEVRIASTIALGQLGDTRAVDPIRRLLGGKSSGVNKGTFKYGDERETIRSSARKALLRLGASKK